MTTSKAEVILGKYKAIAWDVDDTLVDGEASIVCQQFILSRPDIDHYILTARSSGRMVNAILPQIASYKLGLTDKNFKRIITANHKQHMAYQKIRDMREAGRLTGPLTHIEIYDYTIKGKVCHELGIPVLVDDNTSRNEMGCTKYGIRLVDPLDLL